MSKTTTRSGRLTRSSMSWTFRHLAFQALCRRQTGRPGYHPGVLLRIYLYGYLNQIQSSRRLERECGRNVELIWLTGRLKPDFKTIADFRKDNGPALRKVCRQFVALCRQMHLLDDTSVAIDGSKFKAVNAKAQNFTREKLRKRFKEIDTSIGRYLSELDRADTLQARMGTAVREEKVNGLIDKIAWLKKEAAILKGGRGPDGPDWHGPNLNNGPGFAIDGRYEPPPASHRLQCAKCRRHPGIISLLPMRVTNVGSDRHQLSQMANQARDALGTETVDVVADKGYYKGEEIVACEDDGITVTLPKPATSNAKAQGRFDRQDFTYDAEQDIYVCPAGQRLTRRMTSQENGKVLHRYWTTACGGVSGQVPLYPCKRAPPLAMGA